MKEIKNPFRRTAAEYGVITLSIWIMVVGIYFFKFPNHFAFGGVTGFSTVVSEVTRWSAQACLCPLPYPSWNVSARWRGL